jgi:hypothetical protein
MAITTYDELVTAVFTWSHNRNDIKELIPDFISLAEIDMYTNSQQPLNIRYLSTTSTALTSTGKRLALPTGFESMRSIRIDDNINTILDYKAPEELNKSSSNGRPTQFTIIGNEIEFNRIPDAQYTIELQYLKRPTDLSLTNQTNEILTNYPNIYLYGALFQFSMWSEEDQQIVKWSAKFTDAIKGANSAWKRGKYGTAPTVQLRGVTP